MYAVIKTGGKQYRVQAGDLLVVEKLEGEPGANVAFGDVLMLGDGETITLGAPIVEGATVSATLIETRKGLKVKIFKKRRRQGYRRTRGHRQHESVLRVTSVAGAGKTENWDGVVDMTTKAVLNWIRREARRGVTVALAEAATAKAALSAEKAAAPAAKKAAAPKAAAPKAEAAEKKAAAPKKAAAKKPDAE